VTKEAATSSGSKTLRCSRACPSINKQTHTETELVMAEDFFDASEASHEPGRSGERLWNFLVRSSWEKSARARAQLTWLLRQVPQRQQPALLSRLRSADEPEVHAAQAELFVFALMAAAGRVAELDPPTRSGRSDVLVDGEVHLEVHRASLSDAKHALVRRRREVVRGLEGIASPDFWLGVRMSVPKSSPGLRAVKASAERWLAGLDWNDERTAFERDPSGYDRPTMRRRTPDGEIVLEALPKPADQCGSDLAVGTVVGDPCSREASRQSAGASLARSGNTSSLSAPLVVVLDLTESITHDDEIAAGLFGPVVYYASAHPPYEARDRSKGVWPTGTEEPKPAAVMTVDGLRLGQAQHAEVALWLPPGRKGPLADGPWRLMELSKNGEKFVETRPQTPLDQISPWS
jgi:hypothetical protein